MTKRELVKKVQEKIGHYPPKDIAYVVYLIFAAMSGALKRGEMMGVTRERIRQIEAKALKKLQHKKRREQLKDFASPDSDWDFI